MPSISDPPARYVAPAANKRIGRKCVTVDDIKSAIDRLGSAGLPVTLRSIRVELGGTGSASTIYRHVKSLRDVSATLESEFALSISATVLRALEAELTRFVRDRTASAEMALRELQASMEVVVQENANRYKDLDEFEELVSSLRAQLERQAGREEELRAELQRLRDQHREVQGAAELVGESLALAQQELRSGQDIKLGLQADLALKGQELIDVRGELDDARKGVEQFKKAVAVLDAERNSMGERLADAQHALSRSTDNEKLLLEKLLARPAGAIR